MSTDSPALDIIFFDDDLIIANKPPWLLSVPGRRPEHKDSLSLRAANRFGNVLVVHRLDCATSGIMVMARHAEAQRRLNRQFQNREVQKTYVAVGYGRCPLAQGELHAPMRVDWPKRPRQKVDWLRGKASHTCWRVLQQQQDRTRFELTPVTGRSHQLRVHLKCLGHPIVGDRLYASAQHTPHNEPRMLLHAHRLIFTHPMKERRLDIRVDSPF